MKSEILAIGTELVSGQSLDTNSQWLSRALGDLGIATHFHTSIGDDRAENIAAFRVAIDRADLIITSGGLGPTQDDLTREILAELAGVPLVEDAASIEAIAALFARRNRTMTDRNRVQALFPRGAEVLANPIGTAPGIAIRIGNARIASLPGVPKELKRMFDEQVVPWLKREGLATRIIVHRKINMFGKGESDIEAEALDLTARGRIPEVGITASDATISFRVAAEGATEAEARALMQPTIDAIYARFAPLIVGEGTGDVVDALAAELARTGRSIAIVDACTGGLAMHMLGVVPGVGPSIAGGLVVTHREALYTLVGVDEQTIQREGLVGPDVAMEMAARIREQFEADVALALTGVPTAEFATPDAPVGTAYLGLATLDKAESRKVELGPEQPADLIRRRAAKVALNWARTSLLPEPSRES